MAHLHHGSPSVPESAGNTGATVKPALQHGETLPSAHGHRRGELLTDIGPRDGEVAHTGCIEGVDHTLKPGNRLDIAATQLDEAPHGGVGDPSLAGDLPHRDLAVANAAPELVGGDGDGLHSAQHNGRFIERSSVRLTVRARNRPPCYLLLMPKSFAQCVKELSDAIGSYEEMQSYFGGSPVKSTWSDFALGKRRAPGARLARKIADQLGCSVAQLTGEQPWPDGFLDRLRAKADAHFGRAGRDRRYLQAHRRIDMAENILASLNQLGDGIRELIASLKEEATVIETGSA